jgi:hypothetical protein
MSQTRLTALVLVLALPAFLAARAESAETITPSDVRPMIARFMSSEEGRKLRLPESAEPARISAIYGPFVDPHNGQIRLRGWWIDSGSGRVLWATDEEQVVGTFVKKGDVYAVVNARRVKVSRIEPQEAKTMLLSFLSSADSATLPAWVRGSRLAAEAGKPLRGAPEHQIVIGPWRVDPNVETVTLAAQNAELDGTIRRVGEKYVVENAKIRDVRRLEPGHAKAMILRFLGVPEAAEFPDFIKSRELVEKSSPTVVVKSETISIRPWIVNPLTQEFRLTTTFRTYYGMFVKQGDEYNMFLVTWLIAEPPRGRKHS